MKEYIERAVALEALSKSGVTCNMRAHKIVASIQAADVVEMRHGRWGEYESFPLTPSLNGHPCSECGMRFSTSAIPVMKYCPSCGALMDGKEDGHDKHPSDPV